MDSVQLLSVLTPTYNCSEYIIRCYDSLNSQTYTNWEWIVVDDGSTDNTLTILRGIDDNRIKIVHYEQNRGRGYARNAGIEASSGDVIVMWDMDDMYLPERLALIYKSIVIEKYDFFVSEAVVVRNNFEIKGVRSFKDARLYKLFVHPTLAFKKNPEVFYDQTMKAGEDLLPMIVLSKKFRGYFSKEILMVYFEDREINLKKTIQMHDSHTKTMKKIIREGVIYFDQKDKVVLYASLFIKKIILSLLQIYPPLYLYSVKLRTVKKPNDLPDNVIRFLDYNKKKYTTN